jgi:hypothetical protein
MIGDIIVGVALHFQLNGVFQLAQLDAATKRTNHVVVAFSGPHRQEHSGASTSSVGGRRDGGGGRANRAVLSGRTVNEKVSTQREQDCTGFAPRLG